MKKTVHSIIAISIISLVMEACSSYSYDEQSTKIKETEITSIEENLYDWSVDSAYEENINVHAGFEPSETDDGVYFLNGNVASYYDCEAKISTPLCAQQGCNHNDETCGAYIQDATHFGVYKAVWYTMTKDKNADLKFNEINPSTGQSTELYFLKSDNEYEYSVKEISFAYNNAYFFCEGNAIESDNDYSASKKNILVKIDLKSKEVKEIQFDNSLVDLFIGGTDESFFTMSSTLKTDGLLSYEEYYEENDHGDEEYEGDSYRAYYSNYTSYESNKLYEIRKYNIASLEYEVITTDNVIYTNQGNLCYGDVFTYVSLNHENGQSVVWIYDMKTGKTEKIYTDEWIVEYAISDGKVICNIDRSTSDNPNYYEFCYVNIFTKEVVDLRNNNTVGYSEYPVWGETKGYMISPSYEAYNNVYCLSKEKYYGENYEEKELVK